MTVAETEVPILSQICANYGQTQSTMGENEVELYRQWLFLLLALAP